MPFGGLMVINLVMPGVVIGYAVQHAQADTVEETSVAKLVLNDDEITREEILAGFYVDLVGHAV
jgi:hypothetical protein